MMKSFKRGVEMENIERFFRETVGPDAVALTFYQALIKKKEYLSRIKMTLTDRVRTEILSQFAIRGQAPSISGIAENLSVSGEVVKQALNDLAHYDLVVADADGDKISSAYPFSSTPTAHQVKLEDGGQAYALCAVDALGVSSMLGIPASIKSSCFQCGGDIDISINGGSVLGVAPSDIAVWLSTTDGCGCTAETMCPLINFFCSAEHLNEWRQANPEEQGFVLDLNQALELGRLIFGDFLT